MRACASAWRMRASAARRSVLLLWPASIRRSSSDELKPRHQAASGQSGAASWRLSQAAGVSTAGRTKSGTIEQAVSAAAIAAAARMRDIMIVSFRLQRDHRVEIGSLAGRQIAEEKPGGKGTEEGEQHRLGAVDDRATEGGEDPCRAQPQADADQAAQGADRQRLGIELGQDVEPARAGRHAHADLAGALGDA